MPNACSSTWVRACLAWRDGPLEVTAPSSFQMLILSSNASRTRTQPWLDVVTADCRSSVHALQHGQGRLGTPGSSMGRMQGPLCSIMSNSLAYSREFCPGHTPHLVPQLPPQHPPQAREEVGAVQPPCVPHKLLLQGGHFLLSPCMTAHRSPKCSSQVSAGWPGIPAVSLHSEVCSHRQ